MWKKAQEALLNSSRKSINIVTVKEEAAPYYGPRADIIMRDDRGRYHLFARIQLDFELPERFDLGFMRY
ncbi:hypothetical protein OESDEN_11252 [Oesophagostomum dentatum]|uniref:Uncharacterized protein n=1 Tax=Oesophagostomum dentatum TaxID=61180 RepID=A0A0B1SZJ9_OESDE|nr:hypothetical protein OESDEN_11252 [Oesophagostomum dentatum]